MKEVKSKIIESQYKILSEIKQGGFGTVYLGWDLLLEKPIAIKEILPELLGEAKAVDMFQDEAINTAKLTHPNILHVINLRKTRDDKFYIIMEYIEGIDLHRLLKKLKESGTDLPLHLKLYVIDQVCQALDYAHNKVDTISNKPLNIVHRDISPANIMINTEGTVKLIDFGIAKVRFRKTEKTKAGILKGKIPYMSPEQILGKVEPDRRSDLFSLGIVLFEIITMTRPFQGKSEFSIMEAVLKAKVDLKTLEKSFPEAIINILIKSLQKDVEKRYQTAQDIHSDIVEYFHEKRVMNPQKELKEHIFTLFGDELHHDYSEMVSRSDAEDIAIKTYELQSSLTPSGIQAIAPEQSGDIQTGQTQAPVEPEPVEQEEKTIFDVIRLSRRNLKKYRVPAIIALLLLLSVLAYSDFKGGWTPLGKWLYSKVYPFSLTIDSIPRGAEIFIDDEYLNQTTPFTYPGLSEGSHKIELKLAGFPPKRTTFVSARNKKSEPLIMYFESAIHFESEPEGATVYLGNRRLTEVTPCEYTYQVGDTLSVKMELEGFLDLADFELSTLHGHTQNLDARLWELNEERNQGLDEYVLKGTFEKEIGFVSHPSSAAIYVDDETRPLGNTNGRIKLTVGRHKIRLSKSGFADDVFFINVDKDLNSRRRLLEKIVAIQSYSLNDRGEGDLNATIIRAENLETGNIWKIDRSTPTQVRFQYSRHRLFFEKSGYQDTSLVYEPSENVLVATMRREDPKVVIVVVNADSAPVTQCSIYYKKMPGGEFFSYLNRTDKYGVLKGTLPRGQYQLEVDKTGYTKQIREFRVDYNHENKIEVVLEK